MSRCVSVELVEVVKLSAVNFFWGTVGRVSSILFSAGRMIKMERNCLEHGYKSALENEEYSKDETRWLGLKTN